MTSTGTVYIFGSINADTSIRMRALPAPGETVIASASTSSAGGKGANQAIAASAAGAATRMIGAVGDDSDATAVIAALDARGIDTGSIAVRSGSATGLAIVYVDDDAENSIVVVSGANATVDFDLAATALAGIGSDDVLILQNEVPAEANRAAARAAASAGAQIVWNAAPAPASRDELVPGVDLLVVNEHELRQIGSILGIDGRASGDADLLAAVAHALGTDAICTLGPDGGIFHADGESGSVAAPAVDAVDTTAAGDTVVGYLAANRHLPIAERLRFANFAGALTVTRQGASTSIPHHGDVEQMLAAYTERTTA